MSRGDDDYQSEPVRGLPEVLPPGEQILWQGTPQWWQLAKDAFHVRAVAIYFAGLMTWRASVRIVDTGDRHAAVLTVLSLLPIAMVGVGVLCLLARLSSRTTVYTITNRRVILRIGVALTMAINIPFNVIGAAAFRPSARGTGDISLVLLDADRIAYSSLWPHVRPWRLRAPEPMLRAIPDARLVAAVLSKALGEALPGRSVCPPVAAHNPQGGAMNKAAARVAALGMSASVGARS